MNILITNILINTILTVVFVGSNVWAVQNHYEESFISFAFLYGGIVTLVNAFYIARMRKK